MGLDMYLKAKIYLSEYFGDKEGTKRTKIKEALPEIFGDSSGVNSIEVSFNAGYWRKANAIHRWFVEIVQDDEDDCKSYCVSRESLQVLKGLCKEVLDDNSKAEELLPSMSGFFFGETEYNEYYLQDLRDTIPIIDKCLSLSEDWTFEYQSSW
jgi:hypothetical protein